MLHNERTTLQDTRASSVRNNGAKVRKGEQYDTEHSDID